MCLGSTAIGLTILLGDAPRAMVVMTPAMLACLVVAAALSLLGLVALVG